MFGLLSRCTIRSTPIRTATKSHHATIITPLRAVPSRPFHCSPVPSTPSTRTRQPCVCSSLSLFHSHARGSSLRPRRLLSTAAPSVYSPILLKTRNIGISAHIDSGKTTLTERILYYSGKIDAIHEVKGADKVGATMDFMELEREKGITIQSAATHTEWKGHTINIIDTPGHVDFTIEVERALRVLDGAIMVLCGVAGVQSQSMTVDRQMKRYNVPRLAFINKLDRSGATPWKPLNDLRKKLKHHCAAVQIPIGAESDFAGVVDLVKMKAYTFEGHKGSTIIESDIPDNLLAEARAKRHELLEKVADVDDTLAELFLAEQEPTVEEFKAAIRRVTVARTFVPVFMGSAYKNKGVQLLLDGVADYLPNPSEKQNLAYDNAQKDVADEQRQVALDPVESKPLVALAFKLEENKFGQLTYMRIYQGVLRRGDYITDVSTGKRVKVPRVVRMHANQMEDVQEASSGDIVAMFGVDCHSGTTFTNGQTKLSMMSMHVPEPVISLSIKPKNPSHGANFGKALTRFQKEDPTFKVHVDPESQENIISGMGELHLEIYAERMAREYNCPCVIGQPQVNYRETCTDRAEFNYTHKKQSGGAGQYGKVVGYLEPLPEGSKERFVFENKLIGNVIPPEFHAAVEKGFVEAIAKGLAGYPVYGVRVVLTDGQAHAVDSSEMAFKIAAWNAFRQGFKAANMVLLEPIMAVEIEIPSEFQGAVVANLNRKKGVIDDVQPREGGFTVIKTFVPLAKMFGYSTDLRSCTEGKGEFSMEYARHEQVSGEDQNKIQAAYEQQRLKEQDAK